jgi:hypothetical protein
MTFLVLRGPASRSPELDGRAQLPISNSIIAPHHQSMTRRWMKINPTFGANC